ncbi:hypothetical protein ACHAWF_018267 [Thalassiosira exigua]
MASGDLLQVLSRNLPDDPHDHVFGKAADATAADAVNQSKRRAVPNVSVYVVSTNTGQESFLKRVWDTVPSRFFVMQGDDFFTKANGRYDTMGTDRLATLTGAVHLHGHPALVFDGGTATTYSATNEKGAIMGGGIGPGIQSKFRSLAKDTDALPVITAKEVLARVEEAQKHGKPLPTFARNTTEAIMVDAFQEFALKGRNPRYKAESSKHLIHYGIACVLSSQVKQRRKAKNRNEHVGKRVAKKFPVEADDGDNVFRGHVSMVVESGYRIIYDDGDKEDVAESELQELFEQYTVHGEKKSKKAAPARGKSPAQKKSAPKEKQAKKKPQAAKEIEKSTKEKAAKEMPANENAAKEKVADQRAKRLAAAENESKKKVEPSDGRSASKAVPQKERPSKKIADVPSFPVRSGKGKSTRASLDLKKPAAKRAKTANDITAQVNASNPHSFVRRRVAKDFDGETYYGTIMAYDDSESPAFWHVEYEDGDEEDYSKKDLIRALKHYEKTGKKDANK